MEWNGMDKNDGGNDRVQIEMNKMDHDLDILWRRRLYEFIGRVILFYSIPLYATIQLLIEWLPLYLIYIWTTTIDRLISTAIWHVVHCARNCLNPLLERCMRLSKLIVRVPQHLLIQFILTQEITWIDCSNDAAIICLIYYDARTIFDSWCWFIQLCLNMLGARIGPIIVMVFRSMHNEKLQFIRCFVMKERNRTVIG